jgi:anti-sigma B factor antagonist
MSDPRYLVEMISGVPVVTGPAEIDVTTTDQLRAALRQAAAPGHATVVVDMTRTRLCDSAALGVLIRAHQRALEEGGEVRLVIPAGGAVHRIFTLTSRHRFIPRFDSLPEALPQRPALLGQGTLQASGADGESGPVITLSGEADLTSVAQLSALITVHLCGGTRHLTIDVSGLSFADSATVRELVLAARTLKERGGTLVLLHPQPALARVLALTGAERMFAIDGQVSGSRDKAGRVSAGDSARGV